MTDQFESIKGVISGLITTEALGDEHIIRLPIIMPSGSNATVRVIENGGRYFVGDLGLAYLQAESMGYKSSFWRTADALTKQLELERNKTEIGVTVSTEDLYTAVCEVALTSWRVADTVASKAEEAALAEIEDTVAERLLKLFGKDSVRLGEEIVGSSHSEWEFTAVVHQSHNVVTAFQAVGPHAQSVYKASASFHDVALLDDAPKLVAVTRDREELGNRLGLLSQVANVIEENASDKTYRKVAA